MRAKEFRSIVDDQGLLTAMRRLNGTSPYRYTAVFAFEGTVLRNICLVDKLHPEITQCGNQQITDSYCIYVQRTRSPVSIVDATTDPRAHGHPKRDQFQCYYGIPLISVEGKLLGTVCHFNETAIAVQGDVVSALDDVAEVIIEFAFR